MWRFRAPLEEPAPSLSDLLQRAWPGAQPQQIRQLLESDQVRVEERISRDGARTLDPGESITLSPPTDEILFGIPEAEELARGQSWVITEKPIGMPGHLDREDPMHPVLFLADMLGLDRDEFTPIWPLPAHAGGPWWCATSKEEASTLRQEWRSGAVMLTFVALTPRLPRPSGQFTTSDGMLVSYHVTRFVDGICEVQLFPMYAGNTRAPDPVTLLCELMAAQDAPILGDRERGGFMIPGGLRLRLAAIVHAELGLEHSWNPDEDWWPDGDVIEYTSPKEIEKRVTTSPGDAIVPLVVSPKTLEIMEQGHPWVLADSQTGDREGMLPGQLVHLQTSRGTPGPFALVDPTSEIAARFWCHDALSAKNFREEVHIRVDEAFFAREALLRELATTNLFRLIHGQADGLPGFYLDRVGPFLRATITSAVADIFKNIVYQNLSDFDPATPILEIRHDDDIRTRKALPKARIMREGTPRPVEGERVLGVERGLRFWCEPWEGIDTGFFADQRSNRDRLVALASSEDRWLNLFGHTGAFSVALAAQGAHVTNVDISRRYLQWTEENFALNDIPLSLNQSVEEDARAFLKQTSETYDGIIVDPPTAAQSEEGFWSVRKGLETLLEDAFRALKPGGLMLVCRNDRKYRGRLEGLVRAAAKRVKYNIKNIEQAPPSSDYPNLPGFPEGDKFEGILVFGA